MTKPYPSERAAALIREGVDLLRGGEDPDSVEFKRITFALGRVLKDEGAAVAMTFDAIYRETEAEAKLRGADSEAAKRLPLIPALITIASKTGSRSRRQKGATKPNVPTRSRLQLLHELTAIKIFDRPPVKEPVIAIPAEDSGRERIVMRIGVRQFAWVGSFERGNSETSTVQLMPSGHLLVSACGAGYIVDRTSHVLIEKIGDAVTPVGLDDSGSLFIVSHDDNILECFGPRGRLWKTRSLGCGGFRGLTIAGDEIRGEARQASEPEWTPFAVTLRR
jgi:hypothetical protein